MNQTSSGDTASKWAVEITDTRASVAARAGSHGTSFCFEALTAADQSPFAFFEPLNEWVSTDLAAIGERISAPGLVTDGGVDRVANEIRWTHPANRWGGVNLGELGGTMPPPWQWRTADVVAEWLRHQGNTSQPTLLMCVDPSEAHGTLLDSNEVNRHIRGRGCLGHAADNFHHNDDDSACQCGARGGHVGLAALIPLDRALWSPEEAAPRTETVSELIWQLSSGALTLGLLSLDFEQVTLVARAIGAANSYLNAIPIVLDLPSTIIAPDSYFAAECCLELSYGSDEIDTP
jgi:hypothetical protein